MRRSILHTLSAPRSPFDEALAALREIERAHPQVPRFDETTLPARRDGELEVFWQKRCVDHLSAWTKKAIRDLDELLARTDLALARLP